MARAEPSGFTIAVVEDEPVQRKALAGSLTKAGHAVNAYPGAEEFLEVSGTSECPDLVVTDLKLGGMDGLSLLREVKQANPEVQVILITAYGDIPQAVEAVREGAFHFLSKPLDLTVFHGLVREALEKRRLISEVDRLRHRLREVSGLEGVVAESPAMKRILSEASRVAPTDVPVLLTGESGTGKNLLARAIHVASPRAAGPFLTVSCSTLGEGVIESELFGHEKGAFTGADRAHAGYFEQASGGTLLLDEIGEVTPRMQVKLLNVLQERTFQRVGGTARLPVQARVLAATNADLKESVRDGSFREDLYYRLNVVEIQIPTLRSRREDLPLLVDRLMDVISEEYGLERPAVGRESMDVLLRHDYPGNVRELKNVLARAMVMSSGGGIGMADLPPELGRAESGSEADQGLDLSTGTSLPDRLAALERSLITQALEAEDGVKTRSAALLGISERHLRYRMKKYGLG